MASIQSRILEYGIRRMNIFGGQKIDPIALRNSQELVVNRSRPRRKVALIPVDVDGVPSEWLVPQGSPEDRSLLYIHGGAWFMGSTATHRGLVSNLAYDSGARALSINYRLAPENPFPAGLDDCIAAYDWLVRSGIEPEKIIVAGDSAGGNLALALLVALRSAGKPLPAGAVAISPVTDLTGSGESYQTRRYLDPMFGNMGDNSFFPDYIGSHDPHNPLISPLFADLRGLPPLLIHVGDHEVLLDDAVQFGQRAANVGVEVETVVWPGMFHVFHIGVPFLPEARQAIRQIGAFVRAHLSDDAPG